MPISRRDFLKNVVVAAAGIAAAGPVKIVKAMANSAKAKAVEAVEFYSFNMPHVWSGKLLEQFYTETIFAELWAEEAARFMAEKIDTDIMNDTIKIRRYGG